MPRNPIIAALLVLITAAPAVMAAGGGTVSNVPPTIQSFTGDVTTAQNTAPVTEHYTVVAKDPNGEGDFAGAKITSTYASFGTGASVAEWTFAQGSSGCPTSAPPSGWGCTDSTPNDGVLSFQYTYTWPSGIPTGTYTQTGTAEDGSGYVTGLTKTTTFSTPGVVFNPNVYKWNGTLDTLNWGAWTATPGASNVASNNFLKAENQGTNPATISIKYTCADFSGPGGGKIPIASATTGTAGPGCTATNAANPNNVKYCWYQSSLTQVPETGDAGHTYSNFATCQSPVSPSATISINVPPSSRVWVDYIILQMPAILPEGTYSATYSAA
ncbi:MAG: hypothetical protein ACYDBQ_01210 [Thermoplasmatota archaeon]